MSPALRLGTAACAGAVSALGMPPLDLWWIGLAALVFPFWLTLRVHGALSAALIGWTFGVGYFGAGLVWIVEPFLVDVARHGWMAPFALIFMAGGLSLFWAAGFGAAQKWGGFWSLPAWWTLAELLRGYVLTGFPWGMPGYLWAPSPGAQWASVLGSYGLTFLALSVAGLAASGGRVRLLGAVAVVAGVLLGGMGLQPAEQPADGRPIVRVVQPNARQHQKWDPAYVPLFFDRQIAATAADPRPDLVVWPETALPMFLHQADPAIEVIVSAARGSAVVAGVQRWAEEQYFNAALHLDETGTTTWVYDKHHLVPFGEYMPWRAVFARLGIAGLASAGGGFTPGPGPRVVQTRIGSAMPLICYEAVFPQDLRGATRPDYVLHLTNDAWFGTWSGPPQHLMQARMRAIEFGLPVVRAANTGISAVIDPGGRVLAHLPLGQSGFVDAALPIARPPTVYARFGDIPIGLLCCLLIGVLTFMSRRV